MLTPDGQFLKTKNDHRTCEIGEEITFEGETRMGRRASFFDFLKLRPFKLGVFTMTAIILFILILLPVFSDNKAYAYMTLDINPSIEMALNSKYEVIELTPLNHDAKQVISDIGDWKSSDFKEVISNIITDCSKHGYVKESKEILISTVYENTDDNTYKKGVKKQLADMTEKYKGTYQVQSLESDMETREKAKQEGMSTGSYIRRNEKKTEEKQPEKQTDGNETDQKIPKQTLIKASSRTQKSRRLMKRQLLMKKRQQRSRETMKQRPVRKKRSRTVRTAISKPKKCSFRIRGKHTEGTRWGNRAAPNTKSSGKRK